MLHTKKKLQLKFKGVTTTATATKKIGQQSRMQFFLVSFLRRLLNSELKSLNFAAAAAVDVFQNLNYNKFTFIHGV